MKIKPIILVPGEPNSIFFEIFFKAIKSKNYKSPLLLICCKKLISQEMKRYKLRKKLRILKVKNLRYNQLDNKFINIIDINHKKSLKKQIQTRYTRKYIDNSFNLAFRLIKNGYTKKLINGPINKKTFLNKKFYGITEYISERFKERKTGMLIYNKKLSVCPVTTHLPLRLISKKITKKIIGEKIDIVDSFYRENFNFRPKIGVTGMNPHCESILSFNEDEKTIYPVIKIKKQKGIRVKGPYPADTIFLKNNRDKFDVILGMYHDQVLSPLKALFEYDAINITMGLPFLRVSPDHGPNQKMVGKNKSNPKSLINSIKFLDRK